MTETTRALPLAARSRWERPAAAGEAAEARLVERVAAGDGEALAELYRRHHEALCAYLLRLAGDQDLAEEVVQDTLLAVWRGAATFQGRSRVRTWLLGIARRQALGRLRRAVPERTSEELLAELPAPEPAPEELALASAERRDLAAAVGQLSALHQEVLALAFVHGLSYAEIAEVLGVPLGTVKSRLAGARRALAERLREGGEEGTP